MFQAGKIKAVAVAALMGGVSAISVQAANLTSVQGQVYVSRAGGPFQAVNGPTHINPGDVVRAQPGGSAQVIYADGAIKTVGNGSSLMVAADPAAILAGVSYQGAPGAGAVGAWQTSVAGPEAAAAATGASTAAETGAPAASEAASEAGAATSASAASSGAAVSTTTLIVGGAVVAGGGFALASGLTKKSSASP